MFFIAEPVLVPSPPQSCSRPLCRQWPVSTTVQVMFGGLKIILCVYRVLHRLPSFSLAHAPVEHILTCLLKSALQSSTFYCNKSPKSFFYTFSTSVIAFLRAQAPPSLHRHLWIDAFRSQLFHLLECLCLSRNVSWKYSSYLLASMCYCTRWWRRGGSWVAFTLLAW